MPLWSLVARAEVNDGAKWGELRLIAPGDKHGARDVSNLVHLEIR